MDELGVILLVLALVFLLCCCISCYCKTRSSAVIDIELVEYIDKRKIYFHPHKNGVLNV